MTLRQANHNSHFQLSPRLESRGHATTSAIVLTRTILVEHKKSIPRRVVFHLGTIRMAESVIDQQNRNTFQRASDIVNSMMMFRSNVSSSIDIARSPRWNSSIERGAAA